MISSGSRAYLLPPTWGGSLGICFVCCMLYRMVRKHTAIIQGKLQPPHVWLLSSGRLPAAYPGSSAQQRCHYSFHISAGTGVDLPGMTGLSNSFTARGPVTPTDRHFVSTASYVKTTLALPTKKLGCHEMETNISSAYKN